MSETSGKVTADVLGMKVMVSIPFPLIAKHSSHGLVFKVYFLFLFSPYVFLMYFDLPILRLDPFIFLLSFS